MNRSKLTLLWKAANSSLSSISSTVKASLLKRVMKDRKLSFSPCSMVSRLDEERLCLWPPMKLLTNNLLNSSKELTKLGGILLNHTRAGPLRVVGKALHIILGMATGRVRAGFFHTRTRPAGQDPWPEPDPFIKRIFSPGPGPAPTGPTGPAGPVPHDQSSPAQNQKQNFFFWERIKTKILI